MLGNHFLVGFHPHLDILRTVGILQGIDSLFVLLTRG